MESKIYLSFCFFIIFSLTLPAQSWRSTQWELQAGVGSANYFGDIGGTAHENNWYGVRDLEILSSRLSGAGLLRYNHSRHFSFSGNFTLGWLSGCDEGGRNEERGYVFNTIFLEPSGRVEYFFIRDIPGFGGLDRGGMVRNYATVSAYVFAGVGGIIYHVMPNDNLRQRQKRDNLDHGMVTGVLPAGAGVKVGIQNIVDIGLEIGGRWAFNDYLDGFTNPFSRANDIYYVTTVNMVYRLRNFVR